MRMLHQLEGAIPALSVVEVEEKYRKLAEHLLGNVFIADSEDALQNSNGFVVIEKNGKYVKGKYSLDRWQCGNDRREEDRPGKEPGKTAGRNCCTGCSSGSTCVQRYRQDIMK